jgi:hypothetical protein
MAKRKSGDGDLSQVSLKALVEEVARRKADERDGEMTMSEMELAVEEIVHSNRTPAIAAMLSRMKPEKPTAKACPQCGKRVAVKARERERAVRSLSGPVTFKRNYHYCHDCKHGFYPVDYLLGLPEEGDVTAEMEKRLLDFAVNDTFDEAAERWSMHYQEPISATLLHRVADRVGRRSEACNKQGLQDQLLKRDEESAQTLVIQNDGSMLPLRGRDAWKEAKVAVIYRLEQQQATKNKRRAIKQPRFVAVLGQQEQFSEALQAALASEKSTKAKEVVWLADGAIGNWCLADALQPGCTQILDWHHAVEHAMDCGKALLGEADSTLQLWKVSAEQLLMADNIDALVSELLDCLEFTADAGVEAINNLVRYFRNNAERMHYQRYTNRGLPIASGIVESAHRHVLQTRMKKAGQHWSPARAKRMVALRAAYRTAGARRLHSAITMAYRHRPSQPSTRPTPSPATAPKAHIKRRASNR